MNDANFKTRLVRNQYSNPSTLPRQNILTHTHNINTTKGQMEDTDLQERITCLIVIENKGYHFTARNNTLNDYFFPAGSQRWETPAANLYLMGASEPMTFRSLRGISPLGLEEKLLHSKPGDKKDPKNSLCALILLHKHSIYIYIMNTYEQIKQM